MPSFRFVAATAANQIHDGVIEAESLAQALTVLQARGLYVIRIGEPSRLSSLWRRLNQDIALTSMIKAAELARLSQEWASLLEACITVEESLTLIAHTSRPSVRSILLATRDSVKAGMPLHESLRRFPRAFPPVYCALIQAGETAGNLDAVLRRLGDDLVARQVLVEETRNALIYPLFLVITATAGILVLLLVVVPNLESLIGDHARARLPAMTHLVLTTSRGLRDYGFAVAGVLLGLAVALACLGLTSFGRRRVDALLLRTPVIGSLIRTIETGRFARTFGALLSGGVAVSSAMRITLETLSNRCMRTALEAAHRSIVSGAAIGDALAASGMLAEDAIGLIRVGEKTGHLAEMLRRSALMHESRAARRLKALTAMLTPAMTIGFGAIAGVIVYAMLSTILGINELANL